MEACRAIGLLLGNERVIVLLVGDIIALVLDLDRVEHRAETELLDETDGLCGSAVACEAPDEALRAVNCESGTL